MTPGEKHHRRFTVSVTISTVQFAMKIRIKGKGFPIYLNMRPGARIGLPSLSESVFSNT